MKLFAALLLCALVSFCATARAEDSSLLYRATVIVTGEREETRLPGIAECFDQAMAKVSGNPGIAALPGFAVWRARARSMAWSYTLHDRLFGRPIHDEQGSRDRPFDLTVQFDEVMSNKVLAALGEKPWPLPRPKLLVLIGIKDMVRNYVLVDGAAQGQDQRAAFANASERFAVPILFAKPAGLQGLSYDAVMTADTLSLLDVAHRLGADAVLTGHLDWSAKDHGWIGTWRLDGGAPWSITGVNFDAAFRDAIGGAAFRLSGHQAKG